MSRVMKITHFFGESYPLCDRREAWQDTLGSCGLKSVVSRATDHSQAIATRYISPEGVVVARLTASGQTLAPNSRHGELPLLLIPLEDDTVLKSGGVSQPVNGGDLIVLPRASEWGVSFERDFRLVALMVPAAAFRGRKTGPLDLDAPRILGPRGLAGVLGEMLTATARALETLTVGQWAPIERSLAELMLSLVQDLVSETRIAAGTATQSALLHRICSAIERRLDDHELTPARVADSEGISERYVQRLFEASGDNFTLYLRERRLQRAHVELADPNHEHQSVSEIAYRCGFNDATHFSRAFRERFGISPRGFRQNEFLRRGGRAEARGQRGWPLEALPVARAPRREPLDDAAAPEIKPAPMTESGPAPRRHHLPVNSQTVHWGYFSRSLKPVLEIESGDIVTVETLTQHASDDPARMISGDAGAESVFGWTERRKNVNRRGAGPLDASIYGRGAGEGFGVHICTGPIAIRGAEPGDVLEVRIREMVPRPSANPSYEGRAFGSSVAAWWGYHYSELINEPKPREVVTLYEIFWDDPFPHARGLYAFPWSPQIDPSGVVHKTYDYPGVPVNSANVRVRSSVLQNVRIPLRPHFGVIGVAPKETELVDSVPPSYFGGNIDNWRLGAGAAVYLPVSVAGALLSVGDPHAAQGDGEISGTAIECSMTGTFEVRLHKRSDLSRRPFEDLTYPLIETATDWVLTGFSHPNYLVEFGSKGQSEVYAKSSLDLAMKDAFRKARRFLMHARGLDEDEAIALISAAVDFCVTQVVDGNWGVHAVIPKRLFEHPGSARRGEEGAPRS